MIPVPSGLVSTSRSPGRAPALVIGFATKPVTANPYLGSGSSIECPPTIVVPLDCITSAPPRRTSRRMLEGQARFAARPPLAERVIGLPPMAYTSERALAAAIRPQSKGSSTIGVKKSTVCTRCRPVVEFPDAGVVRGSYPDEESRRRSRPDGRRGVRRSRPIHRDSTCRRIRRRARTMSAWPRRSSGRG